ncbi:MAG: hypothetical protein WBW33_37985 [Bryobacteraceae bacterium]
MTYKNERVPRVLSALLLALAWGQSSPCLGKEKPERFWLAGRYDGNRVVVYFDAVKFGNNGPPNAIDIPYPVAKGFFAPVALPASYVKGLQHGPGAERFDIGDHYDLLLGGNDVATMTLTSLVGFPSDEGVGNDSYIGALATLDSQDGLLFQQDYYVVRRPQPNRRVDAPVGQTQPAAHASLLKEPVRFDVDTQIASLLIRRMKTLAPEPVRLKAANIAPAIKVQSFTLADGSLRYYARAEWKSGNEPNGVPTFAFAAWISPRPTLHIQAVEDQGSSLGGFEEEFPNLLNVVDLGNGRAAVIVAEFGEDGSGLLLLEYSDGVALSQMRKLQVIEAGE